LSEEGLAALDKIAAHFGLTRTATIEFVIREIARRDLSRFTQTEVAAAKSLADSPSFKTFVDAIGPTVESGRGKASVEVVRPSPGSDPRKPLDRERVPLPKPGKNKETR